MDVTVSELMSNFIDTPLVVWVSFCVLYLFIVLNWSLLTMCSLH